VGRRAENKLQNKHRAQSGRTYTVDHSTVTFIDRGGPRLLRAMLNGGPQFIGTGIYIKRVLDPLKPNGKRGLLKFISCLFVEPDVRVR
jgi:hypothetical protein